MRDKDELREAIIFLLENPVSDDPWNQANAILEEIDGGLLEKKFVGEDSDVRANLWVVERHREGWVLLDIITGEDYYSREIAIVTMAKGNGGRITGEHVSDG